MTEARFGKLTLVRPTTARWRGNVVGLWRCDCGTESSRAAADYFGVNHKTIRYWTTHAVEGCYVIPRY